MINQYGSVNAIVATDTPVVAMVADGICGDAHGNQLVDASLAHGSVPKGRGRHTERRSEELKTKQGSRKDTDNEGARKDTDNDKEHQRQRNERGTEDKEMSEDRQRTTNNERATRDERHR